MKLFKTRVFMPTSLRISVRCGLVFLAIYVYSMLIIGCSKASTGKTISIPNSVKLVMKTNNCLVCHKGKVIKAGLDLENYTKREKAFTVDNIKSIINRVTTKDKSKKMPPVKQYKSLERRDVDVLRIWLRQNLPSVGAGGGY